jgi:plastocyanin
MSRTLPLAVAAAALLIVAACSSGSSTSTAPSAATSTTPSAATSSAPASQAAPSGSAAASQSAAGGGGAACAASTTAGTVAATIANFAFSPATITAKVGDTVTWTNNDTTAHTATVGAQSGCDTGTIAPGATGSIQFTAAGTYDYMCKIHPNMTGKIEVS